LYTTSSICYIDGDQAVYFRGIDIHELRIIQRSVAICCGLAGCPDGKLPFKTRMAEERKIDASIIYRLN
jgi:hypothetical protein